MPQSDNNKYYVIQSPYCVLVVVKAHSSEDALEKFRHEVNKHLEKHRELIKALVDMGAKKLLTRQTFKELVRPSVGVIEPMYDNSVPQKDRIPLPSYRGLCRMICHGVILGQFDLTDDLIIITEEDGQ